MMTPSAQVASRHRGLVGHNFARGALCDDATALDAAAWAHVDDPVSAADQVQVVLDHDNGRSPLDEALEHIHEDLHVVRMQADGRLIEDEERAVLTPPHFRGQLESLRLTTGQSGRGLAERQVAQAEAG